VKIPIITTAIAISSALVLPFVVVASVVTPTPTLPTKEIALTFDDGPYGTSTQAVLDILEREQVPATFFLIGKNVEEYPSLAHEIVQDGNEVGNHTYDHTKSLTKMSWSQVSEELILTDVAIASSTGVHTRLFRPPYGSITRKLRRELRVDGYTTVLWNADPRDWDAASSTSASIIQYVLHHLKTHIILLLHDGRDTKVGYPRDNMINALPTVIQDLKQKGYTFVTVDALITKN
jgi:peptidoglycan/xylan/chitin deacetylase (PgdA/CDA1 family)